MAATYPFGEAGMTSGPKISSGDAVPESMSDGLSNIFLDMGTSLSGAWADVEDSVSHAWDMTKLTTYGAYLTAEEKVENASNDLSFGFNNLLSAGDGLFSWLQGKLLFILAIGLGVLFLVAKSGLLPQVADTFRAFYGG